MALVSVVIPLYNRATTIKQALQSVLDQTYQDFEILVVDDGSIDCSEEICKGFSLKHKSVRYLRHGHNRGAQAARNTGIKAAQGEWIAFLDSDDQWLPNSLEMRVQKALALKVHVVHSGCFIIRENGNKELMKIPPMEGKSYRALLTRPGPAYPAMLVSREALQKIGLLDESISSWQEWDTAICLARYYRFGFVDEPTFVYDCSSNETISKKTACGRFGYEQVVRKHMLSMLLYAGPKTLSQHYRYLAALYGNIDDTKNMHYCLKKAFVLWPFTGKGA